MGAIAGEDIACYTSQEYDVTHFLHYGDGERPSGPRRCTLDAPSRKRCGPRSGTGESTSPASGEMLSLVLTGAPRCSGVQVIPHIDSAEAEIRVVDPRSGSVRTRMCRSAHVSSRKSPGRLVTGDIELPVVLQPVGESVDHLPACDPGHAALVARIIRSCMRRRRSSGGSDVSWTARRRRSACASSRSATVTST